MARNIHDLTFKQLMADLDFPSYFFSAYLPKELIDILDLNKIKIFSGCYLEEKTNQLFESDVVYLAPLIQSENKISHSFYLHIEHQSTVDKNMALRVVNYQSAELSSYVKQNPKKPEPGIISFIYYQGLKPWPLGSDLMDYSQAFFSKDNFLRQYFGKPCLIDLFSMSDEVILEHVYIGPIELLLKYIRKKDIKKRIKNLMAGLKHINDNLKKILLKYVISVIDFPYDEFIQIIENNLPHDKELSMTLAQRLRQEGRQEAKEEVMTLAQRLRQEGRQEAKEEVMTLAQRLRQEGRQEAKEEVMTLAQRLRQEGRQEAKEEVMTLAERLRQEGQQEGLRKGIEKGIEKGIGQGLELGLFQVAKEMFLEGLSDFLIQKITHLSPDVLLKLKQEVIH